ncbi:DUF3830 family protein [Bacillus luteolus]|uniref:DUF3830 family protein n=1 Tax=Litchfieldia luteola TaxID=682179 RepID=A0ABR9QJ89_9BACI|nr:DUF3830 family protein [Cytobacillus luteolus]MBE4908529.1 DUF3830 family protein [Cytobacillus luteolus]MBP1941381.1 hypothetical protein [Cytobacillus luteolus]
MSLFNINFIDIDVSIRARLLSEKAPATTEAFLKLLKNPIPSTGKHAMYTGKEISIQLPVKSCEGTELHDPAKENLTCFPQPGDILFTFMPAYAWGGVPTPIYDFGLFYGRDARTFFPAGWLPGNLFARVLDEDMEELEEIGKLIHTKGQQRLRLELNS